jgi:hypothetical protein
MSGERPRAEVFVAAPTSQTLGSRDRGGDTSRDRRMLRLLVELRLRMRHRIGNRRDARVQVDHSRSYQLRYPAAESRTVARLSGVM